MKAFNIMTKEVMIIDEDTVVSEAIQKMAENNVSSLIVDRSSNEDTYGIITRRDIVNKVIAPGVEPSRVTVAKIMTKPLLTISPNLAVKHLARLMVQTGVRRMPVFDGHKILGIVSNSDVFRGFAKFLSDKETFLD